MRYRWKMLILFLTIAMVPIMVIRTFGVRAVRQMGDALVSQSRENRISGLQRQIQLLVTSYASVLNAGREQIEMALLLQAREAERCLSKKPKLTSKVYYAEDFNSGNNLPKDINPSAFHFRSRPDESFDLLNVSYSEQVFKLAPGTEPGDVQEDIARLLTLTPVYKEISHRLQDLIYWQNTSLANGLHSAYPGHNGIPRRLNPREQTWYRNALQETMPWSEPYIDPETRQVVVAAAMPIRRPNGTVAGVTALVVPVSSLLDRRMLFQNIPQETASFMIYLVKQEDTGRLGARIFARDEHITVKHRNWRAQMGSDWLLSDDPEGLQAMINDLMAGVSKARRMPYKGKDSLWVYGGVHTSSFLVLITPYEEILKPAEAMKRQVEGRVEALLKFTRYGIYGTVLLVAILAFMFSRSVTKPIRALMEGAQQLARGQFESRVNIRSKDEFGDMGKIFNRVGPRLKELYHMRHSLALAMEVQQNLLPQRDPDVSGMDISGTSIYCDETGGDYYDFLSGPESDQGNIRVVVGDVSDHGIPSALLMTTARALLRQRAALPGNIQHIISDVNNHLARDIKASGRFMTLFYAEISSPEKYIRWVRAGHDPGVIYDPAEDTFRELAGKGLPLGAFENSEYEESQRQVAAGQIIVIGTDGIWETRNAEGAVFGKETLKHIIRAKANKPARKIVSTVIEAVNRFRSTREQEDDITLVVIKIK
ncbi:MAG: SpoIIE family protein phosphatase [Desulfobacterales bacterium]|nr:SpoIIE family protein phosphatase [Desulfobacterales bacterium]